MKKKLLLFVAAAGCSLAAVSNQVRTAARREPLTVTMGQRKPVHIRVARNQATLIRLPENQRVMSVYGGDKGEGGVWSVDAGKVPTRFLAVKPKETGIHTTLHVVSNTGQEISLFLQEITGEDTQFDAEVDADEPGGSASNCVCRQVGAGGRAAELQDSCRKPEGRRCGDREESAGEGRRGDC